MQRELLRVQGITKRFATVLALDGVQFEVRPGEVHGLVGENGAGKSTLVSVIAGSVAPDEGTIHWKGKPSVIHSPHHARELGIQTVFQHLSLIPTMTVTENLFLGREIGNRGILNWRAMYEQAARIIAPFDESIRPRARVADLSAPQRYLVEIAKATVGDFELLILDEPTASLTSRETERLFNLVREMAGRGKGIVWITHRMEELFEITGRITVMRDGRYVTTVPTASVQQTDLITHMTGRQYQEVFPPLGAPPSPAEPPMLEVHDLATASGVRGVGFTLRPGEILGIGGLIGSGKSEVGRALFGLEQITAGQISLFGRNLNPRSLQPGSLIRRGVMYFPADRRGEGIVPMRSVAENMTLHALDEFERMGVLDKKEERKRIFENIQRLNVTPARPQHRVAHLSGGNQQKVVLARGLMRQTRLFIMDEPTQGIDVAAKILVYQFIHEMAASGAAVILISSDILELENLCHRVMVCFRGQMTAIVPHGEATQERLLWHYFGEFEEGMLVDRSQ